MIFIYPHKHWKHRVCHCLGMVGYVEKPNFFPIVTSAFKASILLLISENYLIGYGVYLIGYKI